MGFPDEFLDFMPDFVTVEPWAGQDVHAKPTYGKALTIQCRVMSRLHYLRAHDGQQRVSSKTIYLGGQFAITPRDRLTLPDGVTAPILSVNDHGDEDGPHHTIVYTV